MLKCFQTAAPLLRGVFSDCSMLYSFMLSHAFSTTGPRFCDRQVVSLLRCMVPGRKCTPMSTVEHNHQIRMENPTTTCHQGLLSRHPIDDKLVDG